MKSIPDNVARGAALLDERLPGWRSMVDPAKVDVASQCDCPLGQIFGDYDRGVELLGLEEAGRFGFLTLPRQSYRRLSDGWRRVLAA